MSAKANKGASPADHDACIQRAVVRALAVSSHRDPAVGIPGPLLKSEPIDREQMRKAIAAIKQIPESDLSAAAADEIVSAVEKSAEMMADLVGQHLNGVVEHRKSIGCVSDQEIAEYAASERQVLVDLYFEAGSATPSPTKLLEMALRYGLDARKAIEGSPQRFELQRTPEGWEIIEYASPALKIPGIGKPGRLITNAFAVAIFNFLTCENPALYQLRSFLENLLGEVPKTDSNTPQLGAASTGGPGRVRVDVKAEVVYLDEEPIGAELNVLLLIQAIVAANGKWISSREIQQVDPDCSTLIGSRPDRVFKKIPKRLQDLFESKGGKGYRFLAT